MKHALTIGGFIIAGAMTDFPSWYWLGAMLGCALVYVGATLAAAGKGAP